MLKIKFTIFVIVWSTMNSQEIMFSSAQSINRSFVEENWSGRWFPFRPGTERSTVNFTTNCDDGKNFIAIDYDPNDLKSSHLYQCLEKKKLFEPNLHTKAKLLEYVIPPAYVAPTKCNNESINYTHLVPTFGASRPVPPKFGTYRYLPPQRWVQALARGAIVLLYHPCASPHQTSFLQNIVKSCVYRHIITPYNSLSAMRPFAVVVWGKCLQMSVIDKALVVNFIKQSIPKTISKYDDSEIFYDIDIITGTQLLSDKTDPETCVFT